MVGVGPARWLVCKLKPLSTEGKILPTITTNHLQPGNQRNGMDDHGTCEHNARAFSISSSFLYIMMNRYNRIGQGGVKPTSLKPLALFLSVI
jgi:hypothetical protein